MEFKKLLFIFSILISSKMLISTEAVDINDVSNSFTAQFKTAMKGIYETSKNVVKETSKNADKHVILSIFHPLLLLRRQQTILNFKSYTTNPIEIKTFEERIDFEISKFFKNKGLSTELEKSLSLLNAINQFPHPQCQSQIPKIPVSQNMQKVGKIIDESIIRCSALGCQQIQTDKIKLKKCSRCNLVYYCSPECQRAHWKTHKLNCKAKDDSTSASATAGSTSSDNGDSDKGDSKSSNTNSESTISTTEETSTGSTEEVD